MAVEGWVGWHGQGKTYCAVERVLRVVHRDRRIQLWTNAEVYGSHHFDTWDELMALIEGAKAEGSRVLCLVDEAGKFLSSRFWAKMDPRVLTLLQERRKVGAGVDLFWTAPSWRMVDVQLRDVTQYVHVCRRFGGSEYSHDVGRPPAAFWQKTYRPDAMSTDSASVRSKAKTVKKRLLPFSPDLAAMYGTAVLDMSKPMAAELALRPDYLGPAELAPPAPPAVVPMPVAAAKGRRR